MRSVPPVNMYTYLYSLLLVLVTSAVSFAAAAFYPLYSRARTTRKTLQTRPRHLVEKCNDCPYEYILHIYGRNHFHAFIDKLDPSLKFTNPKRRDMVCEIMDVVHFTAILVDDVTPLPSFPSHSTPPPDISMKQSIY